MKFASILLLTCIAAGPATQPAPPTGPDIDEMGMRAKQLIARTRAFVIGYEQAAEKQATAALESTPQYQAAAREVETSQRALEDARALGDPASKLTASAAYNRAVRHRDEMRTTAMQNNDEVVQARAMLAETVGGAPVATVAAGNASGPAASPVIAAAAPAKPATSDDIRYAIRNHTLVIGMTVDEATRSAGSPPILIDARETTVHYRWSIQGVTGYSTRYHTDILGHQVTEQTPISGQVGQVFATFVDGKLAEFSKTGR